VRGSIHINKNISRCFVFENETHQQIKQKKRGMLETITIMLQIKHKFLSDTGLIYCNL
jgi:hypothetical protein